MNSTVVQCMVPPAASTKEVRVRLLISNNYVIDSAILYLSYEDATEIDSVDPSEGYIAGDVYVNIYGNFSLFY
jgi:hypothetical protein